MKRAGRLDDPPMSVLGVTENGVAAVIGRDLALRLAASKELLEACQEALRRTPKHSKTIRPMLERTIAKALGKNDKGG